MSTPALTCLEVQRMVSLFCRMCDELNLKDLAASAGRCGLQELNLGFVAGADDAVLAQLAALPRMRRLFLAAPTYNLWMHGRWTAEGLEEFKRSRPEVEVVLRYS